MKGSWSAIEAAHRHFCGAAAQDGQTTSASKAASALQVLVGQLNYFPELPSAVPALHRLCNEPEERPSFEWVNGQLFLRFGRHKGELLSVVVASQSSYLGWMLGADFGQKTDGIVARALQGDFSEPIEKTA